MDLFNAVFSLHPGDEIPNIPRNVLNGGPMGYVDQGIIINRSNQVIQICLNVHPFKGGVKSPRHSAQFMVFFDEIHVMILVGNGERARHACDTTAHHQRRLVHGQIKFLQGLQMTSARHRHADDILRFTGGLFLLLGMDPGAMFPDIGHITVILIQPRFPKGVPE